MNNLLKQTKLNLDAIELDSKNTITDTLKTVHERLKKLNTNMITRTDNDEITNILKLITKKDLNSIQLTELKIHLIFEFNIQNVTYTYI